MSFKEFLDRYNMLKEEYTALKENIIDDLREEDESYVYIASEKLDKLKSIKKAIEKIEKKEID